MRKIINGKMYDTNTAKEIYYWNNGSSHSDFDFCEETLFCKRTGEFFLYGSGGASSKYSRSCGLNNWEGSEKVIPLTEDKARKWMETHADVEDYIKIFGEPEE